MHLLGDRNRGSSPNRRRGHVQWLRRITTSGRLPPYHSHLPSGTGAPAPRTLQHKGCFSSQPTRHTQKIVAP
ncbi:hypothetical protein E2C01_087077 [Portunus trituberculatus]|uniref:Uncharacterized protein n=1 Tax=Portunus trituberculatus TaxID=210409 RepID=A0A5B7JB15_PORTR|nr:hypothetical protein [Portunus trituberculatus]